MVNERTSKILEAAIQGFIDTGEPISSGWLYERHDFGIKPAMIRLELEELSSRGFLEQPHCSAGRVPTNEGYEFFVEWVLENDRGLGSRSIHQLLMRGALSDLARELASELGLLSVAAKPEKKSFYQEGLEELVGHMDWLAPEDIKSVIHDFVEIEERLGRAAKKLEKVGRTPKVFVGKQSPITKSDQLSVVMGRYECDGDNILLFAIGPKRMDYRKTLRIFKNL